MQPTLEATSAEELVQKVRAIMKAHGSSIPTLNAKLAPLFSQIGDQLEKQGSSLAPVMKKMQNVIAPADPRHRSALEDESTVMTAAEVSLLFVRSLG
jgi:hypothetical protein